MFGLFHAPTTLPQEGTQAVTLKRLYRSALEALGSYVTCFTAVEVVWFQSTENNRMVKARFTCTRVLYHMAELDIGVVIHTSFLLCS